MQTDLSEFLDDAFDVVFSNSVIEHLQAFDRQAAMAAEVRRFGSFVLGPDANFCVPDRAAFFDPGWHWLPTRVRIALLRRRRWGWGRVPTRAKPTISVRETADARYRLRQLFPDAVLRQERIGPAREVVRRGAHRRASPPRCRSRLASARSNGPLRASDARRDCAYGVQGSLRLASDSASEPDRPGNCN